MAAFFVLVTFDLMFPAGTPEEKKEAVRKAFYKELGNHKFIKAKTSTAFVWAVPKPTATPVHTGQVKIGISQMLKQAKATVVAQQQQPFSLVVDFMVSYTQPENIRV